MFKVADLRKVTGDVCNWPRARIESETMMNVRETPVNQSKLARLERAWQELLEAAMTRGYHGTVGLEVTVQDGTIQHFVRRIERREQ